MFRVVAVAENTLCVGFEGDRRIAGQRARQVARSLIDHLEAHSVVSGTRTVLLSSQSLTAEDLEPIISEALSNQIASEAGVEHTLEVTYDGPDLEAIAESLVVSVDEVIELHSRPIYEVAFIGFQPGFAYLEGLDRRLTTIKRLPNPRVSIPAGSVAIAGGWAGVYPLEGPGGWQVVGTTDATIWDPNRERPTLWVPGDRVRFKRS
ncbi:MAG: 5-oxoprolinase subunit B family protein [Actinomycetota bacterium]